MTKELQVTPTLPFATAAPWLPDIDWCTNQFNDWQERYGEELAALPPDERTDAAARTWGAFIHATRTGTLHGDIEVRIQGMNRVKVREIVDDPAKWDGQTFYDPCAPDCGSDSDLVWADLRSEPRPYLRSFEVELAYPLECDGTKVRFRASKGVSAELVACAETALRARGGIYQRKGKLVRVAGCEIIPVTPFWLRHHLERVCNFEFYASNPRDSQRTSCPKGLEHRLLSLKGEWTFPPLNGIAFVPFRYADSFPKAPGYDPTTGFLLRAEPIVRA